MADLAAPEADTQQGGESEHLGESRPLRSVPEGSRDQRSESDRAKDPTWPRCFRPTMASRNSGDKGITQANPLSGQRHVQPSVGQRRFARLLWADEFIEPRSGSRRTWITENGPSCEFRCLVRAGQDPPMYGGWARSLSGGQCRAQFIARCTCSMAHRCPPVYSFESSPRAGYQFAFDCHIMDCSGWLVHQARNAERYSGRARQTTAPMANATKKNINSDDRGSIPSLRTSNANAQGRAPDLGPSPYAQCDGADAASRKQLINLSSCGASITEG